jgi:uncharacterized protein (TIGR03435 family)
MRVIRIEIALIAALAVVSVLTVPMVIGMAQSDLHFQSATTAASLGEQSPSTALATVSPKDVQGTWQGIMHTPESHDQRVVLKIATDEKGGFSAILYNLDRSGPPIVGSSVSFENGTLRFVNDFPGLTYQGKISADGKAISGTIVQVVHSLPLVLERATPETEWAIPAPPTRIQPMDSAAKPNVEVSTVKPTQPGTRMFALTIQGTHLVVRNFSLTNLIKFAYQVQNRQIVGGPGWMDTDNWDIEAKPDMPGLTSVEQEREILKKLFAERFALKIHNEMREMTAYVLTVGNSGLKMTKSADASLSPNFAMGPLGVLRVRSATLEDFTRILQGNVLDRPVVNQTGLTDKWDFILRWTPDETQFLGMPALPPTANDANAPSLFVAIQEQLGLNLNAQKTQVPVLVIDHIEKPSPN